MARAAKAYACALVRRGGRVLLAKADAQWRLPTTPVPGGEDAGVALFRFLARDLGVTPLALEFVCTYPVTRGPVRERGLYHVFEVTGFRRQAGFPTAGTQWLPLIAMRQADVSPVVAAVAGMAPARPPQAGRTRKRGL